MKPLSWIVGFCFVILLIFLFFCDEDSTRTKSEGSHISVSGDLSESYDVIAYFGISTYNSDSIDKDYFTIMLLPKLPGSNDLAMTLMYKSGAERVDPGDYNMSAYAFGDDIPANDFGGSFSGRNVTDYSAYFISSGLLTITESTATTVSGEFNMNGFYVQFAEIDSDRVVSINGHFKALSLSQ